MVKTIRDRFDIWWDRFYEEHKETPTSFESWQAAHADMLPVLERVREIIQHVVPRLVAKHKGSGITLNEEVEELGEALTELEAIMKGEKELSKIEDGGSK